MNVMTATSSNMVLVANCVCPNPALYALCITGSGMKDLCLEGWTSFIRKPLSESQNEGIFNNAQRVNNS